MAVRTTDTEREIVNIAFMYEKLSQDIKKLNDGKAHDGQASAAALTRLAGTIVGGMRALNKELGGGSIRQANVGYGGNVLSRTYAIVPPQGYVGLAHHRAMSALDDAQNQSKYNDGATNNITDYVAINNRKENIRTIRASSVSRQTMAQLRRQLGNNSGVEITQDGDDTVFNVPMKYMGRDNPKDGSPILDSGRMMAMRGGKLSNRTVSIDRGIISALAKDAKAQKAANTRFNEGLNSIGWDRQSFDAMQDPVQKSAVSKFATNIANKEKVQSLVKQYYTSGAGKDTLEGKIWRKRQQTKQDNYNMRGSGRVGKMLKGMGVPSKAAGAAGRVFGKASAAALIVAAVIGIGKLIYGVLDKISGLIIRMGAEAAKRAVGNYATGISVSDIARYNQFKATVEKRGHNIDPMKEAQAMRNMLGNVIIDSGTGLRSAVPGLAMLDTAVGNGKGQGADRSVELGTNQEQNTAILLGYTSLQFLSGMRNKNSSLYGEESNAAELGKYLAGTGMSVEYAMELGALVKSYGANTAEGKRIDAILSNWNGDLKADPLKLYNDLLTAIDPSSDLAANKASRSSEGIQRDLSTNMVNSQQTFEMTMSTLKQKLNIAFGGDVANLLDNFRAGLLNAVAALTKFVDKTIEASLPLLEQNELINDRLAEAKAQRLGDSQAHLYSAATILGELDDKKNGIDISGTSASRFNEMRMYAERFKIKLTEADLQTDNNGVPKGMSLSTAAKIMEARYSKDKVLPAGITQAQETKVATILGLVRSSAQLDADATTLGDQITKNQENPDEAAKYSKTYYISAMKRLMDEINGIVNMAFDANSGVKALSAIPVEYKDFKLAELRAAGRGISEEEMQAKYAAYLEKDFKHNPLAEHIARSTFDGKTTAGSVSAQRISEVETDFRRKIEVNLTALESYTARLAGMLMPDVERTRGDVTKYDDLALSVKVDDILVTVQDTQGRVLAQQAATARVEAQSALGATDVGFVRGHTR